MLHKTFTRTQIDLLLHNNEILRIRSIFSTFQDFFKKANDQNLTFVNQGRPLPLHFLRRNSKAGCVDAKVHTLAKYIMELTILEYNLMHIPPSKVAAGALVISMKVIMKIKLK
jgi:hypothetical protein